MPWPSGLVVKNGSKARAITSGVMPVPVSVTHSETYWPGGSSRSRRRARRAIVGGLDGQAAAVGGIASRALMQRLSSAFSSWERSTRVGHRPPAPTTSISIVGPTRAADQLLHAGDQPVDVGRLRVERLAAREGQQPLGQRGGPPGRALGRIDIAVDAVQPALPQSLFK